MSVWKKLFTAVKGGVNDAAEVVADSQALRILDQEIREAKDELRRSETSLTTILAKQKLSKQKVDSIQASITEHEGYAIAALNKGDESLATEVADKIGQLESDLSNEKTFLAQFDQSAVQLRKSIKDAKNNLRRMEQQVETVKATESVQKAQTAVASRHVGANSKMKTAAESLERIKEKQQQKQAELEAASELASDESGDGLMDKLKSAGIAGSSGSSNDILARLKQKQQQGE